MRVQLLFTILAVLWGQIPLPVHAADNAQTPITVDGREFGTWDEYVHSDYFKLNGKRCGTPPRPEDTADQAPGDCSASITNPDSLENYAPGTIWEIPVVVHIIMNTSGQGVISDELVYSQIEVLNEDFRAIPGTPGEEGTDVTVQFALATVDPDGNPTTGITRSTNNTWFNDGGAYYNTLAWDPFRYLNIYTNSASGALGYVPFLPQDGGVGSNADRLVILWSAFGRPGPIGPPYDQGRTATHELGHYVGLYHTFEGACGLPLPPGCYSTGDLICDTNPEPTENFGCPEGNMRCGFLEPIHNYLDYTDDLCYTNFTPEQARRMRCTLIYYRPQVYSEVTTTAVAESPSPKVGSMLGLNRPNPFNPTTELTFELFKEGRVSLVVMDVNGRPVKTLASGMLPRGQHRFAWNGTDQGNIDTASGVYFYRLETDGGSQTGRMVLVR